MSKKRLKIFRAVKWIVASFTLIFTGIIITFCILTYNLKEVIPQITNIELYDKDNNKYLSYSNNKKQSYVKLINISDYLKKAFISIEDKRFYSHQGIDIVRIGGALISNLKNKGISEGGSTITQQYVKTLFLNSEQTMSRKINEAMIAIKFESMYTKDEILEGYLNAIYFDHGMYGVEDASLFYFNKHASDLSLKESAIIASIPKGPSIYSPIKNYENNLKRANLILKEMLEDEVISSVEYNDAINEEVTLVGVNPNNESFNAPFFQDVVINELKNYPDILSVAYKGLKVYTTLDSKLYKDISESINIKDPGSDIEIACYAIEPKTGNVLAIIGGKDYNKSTFNRAVSSYRQPGSVIKPFLYLCALENGFTSATTFKSEATTFYFKGKTYSPGNYNDIYPNTDISMLYALSVSDNIYAMKTHLFLGTDVLSRRLKEFGFEGEIPTDLPSLALGTKEVSLEELTRAYSALANLGTYIYPKVITKITTYDGEILYEAKTKKKEIANDTDTYILNETMTSIFDNKIIYNTRPTGAIISSLLTNKYAGKSGSTDTDNWMVGYNQDLVLAIWTGYDDNKIITSSSDKRYAKYVFADVIEKYFKDKDTSWYDTPSDVIGIDLNPITGFYGNMNDYTKTFYFRKSNIPWYIKLLYLN